MKKKKKNSQKKMTEKEREMCDSLNDEEKV